ncbi:protein KRI1 homolog isoform X2 [Planococcus citri]|uniref:protein KRI1 homolog isoform X2 n=1 Tax=Planococcus citri TaxID=170843 RepID=UPI0031F8B86A
MSEDLNDEEKPTETSSSSEEEDENAKEWTDEIEKTFLKTLSSLKKKDPKIYDDKVKFFKDELISSRHPPAPKEEHLYLKDYERKIILEKNGILTDEESDDEKAVEIANERAQSPTYVEEQRILKESFKKMLQDDDSNDSENETAGFLKVKEKTSQEKAKEEADYIEWLKGQKTELEDKETEGDLKYLRDYWTDPKLNEGEQFLRDYILNKKYLEPGQESEAESELSFSEEEKQLEECDEYEQKYNFRFEEPDQNFIKTYPRVIENSLRRKDEKRKEKRQALKKRKEEELAQKRLEVKKLKKQKKQELLEKIKKLKEITGNDELGFNDEELQKDFSPDEYDKTMGKLFNEEFYELDDMNDTKPQFSDSDSYDYEDGDGEEENFNDDEALPVEDDAAANEDESQNDDSEIIMDCDYDPTAVEESKFKRQTRSARRKGHKKSKLMEAVRKEKAVFNASEKSFEQYLDEYYGLDFEDTVGDMPCRFKYRKVPANSFGLSVEEILAADDKELNKWVSMQKIDTIRPENIEKFEQKVYSKKARDENLKRKLLPSLFTEKPEEGTQQANANNEEAPKKKKKKKRRSKKVKMDSNSEDVVQSKQSDVTKPSEKNDKKFNRKRKATDNEDNIPKKKSFKQDSNVPTKKSPKKDNIPKKSFQQGNSKSNSEKNKTKSKDQKFKKDRNDTCEISDERLKAYGINPKKYKNKLKYAPK